MIGDFEFFKDDVKVDTGIYLAKEIFGENIPYIFEQRLDGQTIVFSEHFIRTSREAMTTGCMAKMNSEEEELFQDFVDYQDGSVLRDISGRDDSVLVALDEWFNGDVFCYNHPVLNECFDADLHTWEQCAT